MIPARLLEFFPTVSVVVVRFSSVTSFLLPSLPPLLSSPLLCGAVQLTTPIGDDGQLMSSGSSGRPVL